MGLSYQELVRENQELRIRLARLEQGNQALKVKVAALEAELRRRELEEKLDALIAEGRRFTDPDNAWLAKRLRKQRKNLFTFLEVEEVEPTNNRAERALRPAVVVRKTGGCNRTPRGARTHTVLASFLVTVRQQGKHPVDHLTDVLTTRGRLQPLPLGRSPPVAQSKSFLIEE
jgi:transposase